MAFNKTLSPLDELIVDALHRIPAGLSIDQIEREVGRELHDEDVRRALVRLKAVGIIIRSGTNYDHRIIWRLI